MPGLSRLSESLTLSKVVEGRRAADVLAARGVRIIDLGIGEPSGPGVVRDVVVQNPDCDLTQLSEVIKRTVFKITRAGELIGTRAGELIGWAAGITFSQYIKSIDHWPQRSDVLIVQ
jgi:uncharacterized protein (UPF0210 family)